MIIISIIAILAFLAARYTFRHGGSCETCSGSCGSCHKGNRSTPPERFDVEKCNRIFEKYSKGNADSSKGSI